MNIQEKFENLTPEQREKLSAVNTEQELDAFLTESGIETTAEERTELSLHLKAKNAPHELSDEELEEAAGGKGWKQCPFGHFEATGFANVVFGMPRDCYRGKCDKSKWKFLGERTKNTGGMPIRVYTYRVRCEYFNREVVTEFTGTHETNWD